MRNALEGKSLRRCNSLQAFFCLVQSSLSPPKYIWSFVKYTFL